MDCGFFAGFHHLIKICALIAIFDVRYDSIVNHEITLRYHTDNFAETKDY